MDTLIDDVLFTIISGHKYTMFVCRRWRDLLASNGITIVPANELIYVKEWALESGLLVEGGVFDVLLSLISVDKRPRLRAGLKYCVRKKYMDVLSLFLGDAYICFRAAREGYLDILKWARENGCPWSGNTCSIAARHGHLHVLQWARENGCLWGRLTCSCAAEGGHLDILKWARMNGCPWDE